MTLGLSSFSNPASSSAQQLRRPAKPRHINRGDALTLRTDKLVARWQVAGGKLLGSSVVDQLSGRRVVMPADVFVLLLKNGEEIRSSQMRIVNGPKATTLTGDAHASRRSERLGGAEIRLTLEDVTGHLRVDWRRVVRNGTNYARQELVFEVLGSDLPVSEIRLLEVQLDGARVAGTVNGSPVVAGNMFLGFEHPLSVSKVEGNRARSSLTRELPLRAGTKVSYSSVIGVAREGQLRRDFLAYLEHERAHPYRPFLHYNSWYDIGFTNKFGEAESMDVIEHYGRELVRKRGVQMNSFLFDDGWDDNSTLWRFHSGFPRGFTPLRQAAAKYGAAPGVWMSPWGGYDAAKEARLKYGRAQGFEIVDGGPPFGPGFALSGPKYYERFREACMEMLRRYGVNQFKIDGFGNANRAIPGSRFDSDFDAAINLVREMRQERPDLFVNLTVGTYPSPFWLRYGDSIWRGGEDHSFAGVGSDRQQWITYRDAETYKMTVQRGPLFPLNSLMLHGLIYAKRTKRLKTDPRGDFDDEIKSYFGTGTQLQEMYVTPALLTEQNWNMLAEAALWSRRNADVLVDTHWVGGDPAKLEVYGWASWSARRGILVLRNPSDKEREITLDVGQVFELPTGAAGTYSARSPWLDERGRAGIRLQAGRAHTFRLAPLEVLTLEAVPVR
ncbi:MAG TPA: hypothetical protein VMS31_07225 [Pyrinomonadaceae bacterium]|nr:hypothetical protein [Pyrinomonadaceae bacterium]